MATDSNDLEWNQGSLASGVTDDETETGGIRHRSLFNRFWDDWMRLPEQRRDRACIRPEISRTGISVEGKKGVSQWVDRYPWSISTSNQNYRRGQHYEKYLKKIVRNTVPVNWKSMDLSYLLKVIYLVPFAVRTPPIIGWSSVSGSVRSGISSSN